MVTGVHLHTGASVAADLVVDASGRRSALPDWFARAGLHAPVDERQDCGFFYLTRYYRVRSGCETPPSRIPASIALDYANVFASFGADNDTFSLTITLSVDDPYRTAFRDPDHFDAFLNTVPHSAPWIRAGEPISGVTTMSRIENRRHRLTADDGLGDPVVAARIDEFLAAGVSIATAPRTFPHAAPSKPSRVRQDSRNHATNRAVCRDRLMATRCDRSGR